jgi:hypothetical protein
MLTIKQEKNDAEAILIKALNQVGQEYFNMRHYVNETNFFNQRPERAFNAELYHQLRKLQENKNDKENVNIHLELVKNLFKNNFEIISLNSNLDLENDIYCLQDFKPKRLIPDIVFHGGQDNLNNQLLVGELKMDGASILNIIKDLQKLMFYKLSRLKFKNAVLIYTGRVQNLDDNLSNIYFHGLLECLVENNIVVASQDNNNWNIYEFNL